MFEVNRILVVTDSTAFTFNHPCPTLPRPMILAMLSTLHWQRLHPVLRLAIKLSHGVAISWDGRIIRHCTSLSKPDGSDGKRVGEGRHRNHLYGTFTAAKERVVNAGRILSARALQSKPPTVSGDCSNHRGAELSDGDCPVIGKGRRRRRKRKRRGRCVNVDMPGGAGDEGVHLLCGDRPIECRVEASWTDPETPSAAEIVPITAGDLDVGGAYKIPRRKRK